MTKHFKTEEAMQRFYAKNAGRIESYTMSSGFGFSRMVYTINYTLKGSNVCFNCGEMDKTVTFRGCDVCRDCMRLNKQGMTFAEIKEMKKGK